MREGRKERVPESARGQRGESKGEKEKRREWIY